MVIRIKKYNNHLQAELRLIGVYTYTDIDKISIVQIYSNCNYTDQTNKSRLVYILKMELRIKKSPCCMIYWNLSQMSIAWNSLLILSQCLKRQCLRSS